MFLSKLKMVTFGSLLCILSACKITPPISVDYDTDYNYSDLRSYAWVVPKDESKVTTLENKRQFSAIETILNRKGFIKTNDPEQADFLLRTHTITDKKTDVDSFYSVWGYHPYAYNYPYGWPHNNSSTIIREYKIGTLVLDMVDPKKKEVFWRGSVSRKLGVYLNRTPEERTSIALSNAEFLLQRFPPDSNLSSSK